MHIKTSGLYIHIPFCSFRCHYCNFFSRVSKQDNNLYSNYLNLLIKEYRLHIKNTNLNIDTIYIGGGTPSVIPYNLYKSFFDELFSIIDYSKIKEFTFEINPEFLDDNLLNLLSSYKNIRISLGVQTLNEKSLKFINRQTTKADIYNAIKKLEHYDELNKISLDFICGLPFTDINTASNDIKECINLSSKINHISLYYLELEGKENLKKKWNDFLMNEDDIIISHDNALNAIKSLGFNRYEIANFANSENTKSSHNIHYWCLDDYIGLGLSASGCYNDKRYKNTSSIKHYQEFIDSNNLAFDSFEYIDINIKEKEFIFLSLRQSSGIILNDYKKKFNTNFKDKYNHILRSHTSYFDESDFSIKTKDRYTNYIDEISILFF